MTRARMLFLHGADGFDGDRPLAEALGAAFDADVDFPRLPDEDRSVDAWAAPIRARLTGLRDHDLVVAHSFGATILLHALAERGRLTSRIVLLGMPNWGAEGWDVGEYVPPPTSDRLWLELHHCHDDDVVPIAHLALNATRLPSAIIHEHPGGGHQFDSLATTIARS